MLRSGMRGVHVRTLQQLLKDLGYYLKEPSGQFDAETVRAVQAFQRDHQLNVDGIVGRQTWMVLRHFGYVALAETT
ncbi:peptidoglycan-binding protein [Candidatus Parcubacteria bacterium]|nr:MAG: peptidoglycan-binding protein [Candidatus Parcubacteria bacterium]